MIRVSIFCMLFCYMGGVSANLPAEHEAVRLMLAVEESVENSSWDKAAQQLNALEALELDPAEDFFYFNGLVNLKLENLPESEEYLESYIITVGKEGKHYLDALKFITLLESKKERLLFSEPRETNTSSELTGEGRTGYIKSLQALYLTDDPVKALVMQINSLLSVHPYTGLRVKKSKVRTGVAYSVSVNNNGQIGIQEKNYESGFPTLTATKLNVHGVDPFLKYDCKKQQFNCAIYHPADPHLVWIKIEHDDLVVRELVEALTKLIQYLQVH